MKLSSLRSKQNLDCWTYEKYHKDFECCPSCHGDDPYPEDFYVTAPNGKTVFQCCNYYHLLEDFKRKENDHKI